MRRILGVGVTAVLATAGVAVGGSQVAAAPPVNDAYADRSSLVLGSPVTVDTTEATVEALDVEATDVCPFPPGPPPATTNTVWFDWDAGVAPPSQVIVTFTESSFAAGVAVVTGDPGSFTGVACGLSALLTPLPATTYHVLVFDPFGVGGGTTTVTIDEAPPSPTLSLTVDPRGRFDSRTGAAMLSGTYRCTDAFFVDLFGDVRQDVGRFAVIGSFFTSGVDCDGQEHPWTATVFPQNGKFAGGKALTVVIGFSCGVLSCTQAFVEQTVVLTGGRS
jgi:hypothetical protein